MPLKRFGSLAKTSHVNFASCLTTIQIRVFSNVAFARKCPRLKKKNRITNPWIWIQRTHVRSIQTNQGMIQCNQCIKSDPHQNHFYWSLVPYNRPEMDLSDHDRSTTSRDCFHVTRPDHSKRCTSDWDLPDRVLFPAIGEIYNICRSQFHWQIAFLPLPRLSCPQ